jgi:UDP-N-acetylglucosamine enolpyruvyl transferase
MVKKRPQYVTIEQVEEMLKESGAEIIRREGDSITVRREDGDEKTFHAVSDDKIEN